eukprot:6632196-Pyramimonas_sp.AAC.1
MQQRRHKHGVVVGAVVIPINIQRLGLAAAALSCPAAPPLPRSYPPPPPPRASIWTPPPPCRSPPPPAAAAV